MFGSSADADTHRAPATDCSSSSTAKAPRQPNKLAGEGGDVWSDNGRIFLVLGGVAQEVSRATALHEAVLLGSSPLPESRARAARIMAVLEAARDDYTFRAPRFGDLVVCPYCDADTFTCDHCGGERRLFASEVFSDQCDSPQTPLIAGRGGKPRSPDSSPQSTRMNLTPGSSSAAASPTESGSRGRSSPPASGGSRAKSTRTQASFSPLKSAAPKSTDAAQTLGDHGRG